MRYSQHLQKKGDSILSRIKFNQSGHILLKTLAMAVLILLVTATLLPAKKDSAIPENINIIDSLLNHNYDFKGKVVYVDFWASWCAPCQQSFPWMNSVKSYYEKKGLQIVTINLDRDPEMARKFLVKNQVDLPVYFDSTGAIAKKFDIQVMPTSFIFGRDGRFYTAHQGFKTEDKEELEAIFDTLLKEGE